MQTSAPKPISVHRRVRSFTASAALGAAVRAVVSAAPAAADTIVRKNWLPASHGTVASGDLWTFQCPSGGAATIFADNLQDGGYGVSHTNAGLLRLLIADGAGTVLAATEEDVPCTYTGSGYDDCPKATDLSCGAGNPHVIEVVNESMGPPFANYRLSVEVTDSDAVSLPEEQVMLGGGPRRFVPGWIRGLGIGASEPLIDDATMPIALPQPAP